MPSVQWKGNAMRPNGVSRGFLIVVLAAGMLAATPIAGSALDPGGSFSDDNGSIHEGAIEAIAAAGITKGCNPPLNDLYCPKATVTREQMATFLVRALDLPAGDADFEDIGNSVHAANIEALATAGITKGCNPGQGNTMFCPKATVTREQMATFLVRALDLPAGDVEFTDVGASVHAANIAALASEGITTGCNPPTNDRFCPTSPVTREQMATFLARALELDSIPVSPPLPDPSPSDLVVYGGQNWLFFAETVDQVCLGDTVYTRLVAEIEKAEAVVAATGRDFVYTIPPNKAAVNRWLVPGFAGSCAEQNSDSLQAALAATDHATYVDLFTPFEAAIDGGDQLYWKHDTHWNVDGALLGSELIAMEAAPGVWDQLDLESGLASRQGDLATIIGVDWVVDYMEMTPTLAGVTPDVDVSTSIFISNRPVVRYSSASSPELSDTSTAIIHDSFGMFFRNKLGPLFEDATFLPTFTHPIPDDALLFMTASEQIVVEVVERNVVRDFIGTGTAGMLAAVFAEEFAQATVSHSRNAEAVDFVIPAGSPGELRYLVVELDTSGLSGPLFIGDPGDVDIAAGEGAWPDELTPDTSRYGFEIMVPSGAMQLPLPSSVTVTAAYVIVVN